MPLTADTAALVAAELQERAEHFAIALEAFAATLAAQDAEHADVWRGNLRVAEQAVYAAVAHMRQVERLIEIADESRP